MKSKIILCLAVVTAVLSLSFRDFSKVIIWDTAGYYVYLPAAIIYHDLGKLEFYEQVNREYKTADRDWYGIYQDSLTGRRWTKYPVGVAIMELPFFLIAHGLSQVFPEENVIYGYGKIFQYGVACACLFWFLAGLFCLRRFLLRYFDDAVVALTLFLVIYATNLFNYGLLEGGLSHGISFALFSFLLLLTDNWYRSGRRIALLGLAMILGLIIITRPTNVVAALIPLLWGVWSRESWVNRKAFFEQRIFAIVFAFSLCVAVVFIQLSYWHYITGNWILYSYKGEKFDLTNPHILEGLFHYDKGWFIYTPLALCFVAGLIFVYWYYRTQFLPLTLFLIVNIYVVYSWDFWRYGGGFGARPLTESYAFLAFSLAAFLEHSFRWKRRWRIALLCFFILTTSLNLFQTYQFRYGILPPIWIREQIYWDAFGKYKI